MGFKNSDTTHSHSNPCSTHCSAPGPQREQDGLLTVMDGVKFTQGDKGGRTHSSRETDTKRGRDEASEVAFAMRC